MNLRDLLEFKDERIEQEFERVAAGEVGPLLYPVALHMAGESVRVAGKKLLLTGIRRSTEEQRAIVRLVNEQRKRDGLPLWSEERASVHQYWRGFDWRFWIYTKAERLQICESTNQRFRYVSGSGRILDVASIHRHGTAPHGHTQVPAGNTWTATTVA